MLGSTGPRALSIIIVDLQGPSENDPHAVKGRILPSPSPLPTCDTKIGPCTKIWTSNMAKAHQMLVAKALRQFGELTVVIASSPTPVSLWCSRLGP